VAVECPSAAPGNFSDSGRELKARMLQMTGFNDFEIRLYGADGTLQKVVPLVAESEQAARMRAALLCSEQGADSFQVHCENAHRLRPPSKDLSPGVIAPVKPLSDS